MKEKAFTLDEETGTICFGQGLEMDGKAIITCQIHFSPQAYQAVKGGLTSLSIGGRANIQANGPNDSKPEQAAKLNPIWADDWIDTPTAKMDLRKWEEQKESL